MLLGQKVEVVWEDAWFTEEDSTPDDWGSEMLVHTIGWIARIDPTVLHIAAEIFPEHPQNYRAITHIPLAIIREVLYLGDTTESS